MIINQQKLLEKHPFENMLDHKGHSETTSFGLAEAGYDIRIKQSIRFLPDQNGDMWVLVDDNPAVKGRFTLASTIERFTMPEDLVGVVHDKSTWARKALSVFNTVVEPKWKGHLTLELVYHGTEPLYIPAGSGIAQVLFSQISEPGYYDGKYQDAPDMPEEAKMDKDHF